MRHAFVRPGGRRGADRPSRRDPQGVGPVTGRGRRSVALDLKSADGVETALQLIETAGAMFEGFRPGVMERIGLGPDEALARNPALVYGRMTGWGQEGPLSQAAGHDLNYIAISGALGAMGRPGLPLRPAKPRGGLWWWCDVPRHGTACRTIARENHGRGAGDRRCDERWQRPVDGHVP